jgi:hypothetical protein
MTHKIEKSKEFFMFRLKASPVAWSSIYGGLGIRKLQFLLKKIFFTKFQL